MRAHLQRRDGHVVVGAHGDLEVEQAAAVQRAQHGAVRVAHAQAARPRRLRAHRQLHRCQAAELRLACARRGGDKGC